MKMSEEESQEIYYGNRGKELDKKIKEILLMGKLKKESIKLVYNDANKNEWFKVFTHKSADSENCYEYYECLGDSVVNHAVIDSINYRFPQFNCIEGVRLITRLKINLVSKKVLSEWAESLGLWKFVSATKEIRMSKMKPTLEDVLEAFFGLLSLTIDGLGKRSNGLIQLGGGYRICFNIIRHILNRYPICGVLPDENGIQVGKLNYDLLVDFKTQLKELFDLKEINERFGKLKYISKRNDLISETTIYTSITNTLLGQGTAALQAESQQEASKRALKYMRKMGYTREMNLYYKKFCYKL